MSVCAQHAVITLMPISRSAMECNVFLWPPLDGMQWLAYTMLSQRLSGNRGWQAHVLSAFFPHV
jgi:hypothetical protein